MSKEANAAEDIREREEADEWEKEYQRQVTLNVGKRPEPQPPTDEEVREWREWADTFNAAFSKGQERDWFDYVGYDEAPSAKDILREYKYKHDLWIRQCYHDYRVQEEGKRVALSQRAEKAAEIARQKVLREG